MADNDQGMYVSNRDVTVMTDYGYCIRFKKGEPQYVPPLAREDAIAHGVLPVDGELPTIKEDERPVEPIGPQRKRVLRTAIETLISKNDINDFTAGGIPKEASVQKEVGFRVARREINEAFKEVKAAKQE